MTNCSSVAGFQPSLAELAIYSYIPGTCFAACRATFSRTCGALSVVDRHLRDDDLSECREESQFLVKNNEGAGDSMLAGGVEVAFRAFCRQPYNSARFPRRTRCFVLQKFCDHVHRVLVALQNDGTGDVAIKVER